MIKAIRDLGAIHQGEQEIDPIQVYTERPSDKIAQVLILDLSNIDNIYPIQYEKEMSYKFLLKAPKGNENLKVPSITANSKQKLNKNINSLFNYFKKLIKDNEKLKKNKYFEHLYANSDKIDNIKEEIMKKANEMLKNLSKDKSKNSIIVSVKYNELFPYEIEYFKNEFIKNYDPYIKKEKVKQLKNNVSICSICQKEDNNLLAGASAFKFYTNDKPGFIVGGLNEKYALKNYPICKNCNNNIIDGNNLLKNKLNFTIAGIWYYLIPKLIIEDSTLLKRIITKINERKKNFLFESDNYKQNEDYILYILKKYNDYISFTFLFTEKDNNALKIKAIIEDVLPSRLSKIINSKEIVQSTFSTLQKQSYYSFFNLKYFFYKIIKRNNKDVNEYEKYLLELIGDIFNGKMIDYNFILKFFMLKLRTVLNDRKVKKYIKHSIIKDAIMNVMFLNNLQILPINEGVKMEDPIFNDFFKKYSMQLDTPEKRSLLLLGALVENLLKIQWHERNAEPFWHQLKSLRMNEIEFKGLVPKVKEKLHQYNKLFPKDKELIKCISNYFLQAKINWNMSIDEMNFYFCCGMSLRKEIYKIIKTTISQKNINKENQNEKS